MNSPTWSVVKFPQENAVSAVPTSWVHSNGCYWPPYSSNLTRIAIEKNEMVDMDNWRLYPCIPFRNATYDTFQEASKKSKIATKTSDLDTCNEDEAGVAYTVSSRKRKIFRKTISFSSVDEEEEEESILPEPPRLKKRGKITADSSSRNAHSSCINTLTDCTNIETSVNVTEPENIQLRSLPQSQDISSVRDPILHITRRTQDRGHQTIQEKKGDDAVVTNSELTIKYLHQIIKKQNILQSIIMDISNRIINLETSGNNAITENTENAESLFVLLDNLPVNSLLDLDQLENYLSISHQMENAIKEVSLIGGRDVYQFIFRAAPQLITNEFAGKNYSFLGRRNKEAFCKLNLNQLLVKACMRSFNTATIKDCENSITKWLRRCLDRCKNMNKEN